MTLHVKKILVALDGSTRAARVLGAAVRLAETSDDGYGGLDRLVGTVAANVVNHAGRNALVVRTAL